MNYNMLTEEKRAYSPLNINPLYTACHVWIWMFFVFFNDPKYFAVFYHLQSVYVCVDVCVCPTQ